MKKTIIAIAAAMALTTANAQTIYDSGKDDSGFGVRVTWDLSSSSTNLPGFDNGSGVSGGVLYNIDLYKNLYFEPGVSFFYDTMTLDGIDLYVDGGPLVDDGSWRNMGFRVPAIFGYRFDLIDDISISVYTGPQLNVGLSLKEHYAGHTTGSLYDKGWRRVDAQWLFGIKLHYLDNFFAEIGGGIGMTNMIDKGTYGDHHFRRNMFNIGVGYIF